MNNDLYLVSAGRTMGETITTICCQHLIGRKGNCPSGYHYRTRHPQGMVYFTAGLLMSGQGKEIVTLPAIKRNLELKILTS